MSMTYDLPTLHLHYVLQEGILISFETTQLVITTEVWKRTGCRQLDIYMGLCIHV